MKRIHHYLPDFFNDPPIENELEVSSTAVGSLRTNQFFLGWAQPDLKELQDKLIATDNLEVDLNKKDSLGVKDKDFFYKSPYSKYNYRTKDNYHILDTIPVDWIVDSYKNKKVLYRYNSEWFRSDHFKKDHDGLHVVFSGCSNTEGVGANIEDTWSYMLYKELSKTNSIDGYYNIAKSGSGWHTIVQNFMVYVDKYGAPDYLFMLHPNILRYFIWKEDGSGWQYSSEGPKEDELSMEYKKQFPTWVISFSVFLKYCESVGTKVLWSTWDKKETDNIERATVFDDTFFRIEHLTNETIRKNNYYELMEREDAANARDGNHDGYIQQYYWFEMFKEEIKKRKLMNDGDLIEV
jgi:hypothetical protein